MKILKPLLLLFVFAGIVACEDNDESVFQMDEIEGLSLTTEPNADYILTFETKDNIAERFSWQDVEMETPVAINYEVQATDADGDFSDPVILGSTSETTLTVTVEEMNNLALQLGLNPFEQGIIQVRVVGSAATEAVDAAVSEVIQLRVTPYTTEAPKLYVPGNYAAASGYGNDWDPADPLTPTISAAEFGETTYEGYIFMNVASPEFKFTPDANWDTNYGDNEPDGVLDDGGSNIMLAGPGYYKVNVTFDPNGDPNNNVYTVTNTSWGIIGTSTADDWNSDQDLTYNQSTKMWEGTFNLSMGEYKFRANDGWDLNFGVDGNGDGSLDYGGDNFMLDAAGMYEVQLDLSNPREYTVTLTQI